MKLIVIHEDICKSRLRRFLAKMSYKSRRFLTNREVDIRNANQRLIRDVSLNNNRIARDLIPPSIRLKLNHYKQF